MREYLQAHSVEFDDRIMHKTLTLPGLPSTSNDPKAWTSEKR